MLIRFKQKIASMAGPVLIPILALSLCLSEPYVQVYSEVLPVQHPIGQRLQQSQIFSPVLLKGVRIYAQQPFQFDFIIDSGHGSTERASLSAESERLIKYFMAALTVPEEDLWVNLSPHEKDRMIPVGFSETDMGRDLLSQDYLLKQLTASLIYPEDELGQLFWKRVHERASEIFGSTDIPLDTFQKVWIVPDVADVYVNQDTAYVISGRLKVLTEKDYLAMNKHRTPQASPSSSDEFQEEYLSIFRNIILPEIEKEVNEGETFAELRQVYHSLILAAWYKKHLQESILAKTYFDQNKTNGIDLDDKKIVERIYNQYLQAFEKGVYDYIREDYDPRVGEEIPRKYFSGGARMNVHPRLREFATAQPQALQAEGQIFHVKSSMVGRRQIRGETVSVMTPNVSPFAHENDNQFVEYVAGNTGKTEEELRKELVEEVIVEHKRMQFQYGFIPDKEDDISSNMNRIFRRVREAYNEQADLLGVSRFEGEFYLVDSPEVNAFVFAEHTDVYVNIGLLREMAHYVKLRNVKARENGGEEIEFSEDLIAGIIAHEMTHVLQQSSYHGIPFKSLEYGNPDSKTDLLELKRQAEYHADEGAMMLLSYAGYNPAAMMIVIDFLGKMTKQSTAELAISDHPHPKERTSHLEVVLNQQRRSFPRWNDQDTPFPMDIDGVMYYTYRQPGPLLHTIRSDEQLVKALQEATTIEQVLGLIRFAAAKEERRKSLRQARSAQSRARMARRIYAHNLLDAMNQLVRAELRSSKKPDGIGATGERGALMQHLTANDELPLHEDVPDEEFSERQLKFLSLATSRRDFIDGAKSVIEKVNTSKMDTYQKTALVERLEDIIRQGLDVLGEIDAEDFRFYVEAEVPEEGQFEGILEQLSQGDADSKLAAIRQLKERAYSVYHTFGQKSLDEDYDMTDDLRDLGIPRSQAIGSVGRAHFEREDFAFYESDERLWPVDTIEDREKVFDAILIFSRVDNIYYPLYDESMEVEDIESEKGTAEESDSSVAKDEEDEGKRIEKEAREYEKYVPPEFQSPVIRDAIAQAIRRTAPQQEGTDDAAQIDLLAQYLSGQLSQEEDEALRAHQEQVGRYVRRHHLHDAPTTVSSIFMQELASRVFEHQENFRGLQPPSMEADDVEWFEIEGDFLAELIGKGIQLIESPEDREAYLDDMLKNVTYTLRRQILESLFYEDLLYNRFDIKIWFERARRVLHEADVYALFANHMTAVYYRPRDAIANHEAYLEMAHWVMDHRPQTHSLSERFLRLYLFVRLQTIPQVKGEGFQISTEIAFDILDRLSSASTLGIHTFKFDDVEDEGALLSGIVSRETSDKVDAGEIIKFTSAQIPLMLFERRNRREGHAFEYMLTRRLFDFDLDQLSKLVRNQGAIKEHEVINKGRLEIRKKGKGFHPLVEGLLVHRYLAREGAIEDQISSQDFSSFLTGQFGEDDREDRYDRRIPVDSMGHLNLDLDYLGKVTEPVKAHLGLEVDVPETQERVTRFMDDLRELGFRGQYEQADYFFGDLSQSTAGLRALPLYAAAMKPVEILYKPDLRSNHSNVAMEYLEVAADAVLPSGSLFRALERYEKEVASSIKLPRACRNGAGCQAFNEQFSQLRVFLPEKSLFRDGFIDQWEAQLLPQLRSRLVERGLRGYVSKVNQSLRQDKERWAARIKERRERGDDPDDIRKMEESLRKMKTSSESDAFFSFQLMPLRVPYLWEKVQDPKFRLNLTPAAAQSAMDFYEVMIPKAFDPQKQILMGMTAMKIFRETNPEASFQEERAAIERFFPFASDLRDDQLNQLLDRHQFPDFDAGIETEEVNKTLALYKSHQDLNYDEELTSANYTYSMLKSMLSSASRRDRMELLFWLLEPDQQGVPAFIKEMTTQYNITFDHLPQHVMLAPEQLRIRMLQTVMLGENGIFNPLSEDDDRVMDETVDRLFQIYFPAEDDKSRLKKYRYHRRVLPSRVYDMIQAAFPVVMREYSPGRRASLAIDLLRNFTELSKMREGQRMGIVLAALGPPGVKIGQILSENSLLIADDQYRDDLSDLKSNNAPLNKIAIVNAIRQRSSKPSLALSRIRIGKRIGSASMKQVHRGWYLTDDKEWIPVVIKALRPRINRTIGHDLRVLDLVVLLLREDFEVDAGDIGRSVRDWIETEKDFRNEVANEQLIAESLAAYDLSGRGEIGGVLTPIVYVGDEAVVMIEQDARGITVGNLMQSVDEGIPFLEWWRRRSKRRALIAEGFTPVEADQILARRGRALIVELRDILLFQIFQDGRFHADPHRDNYMVGANGKRYAIDLGLVGHLNEGQREGASEILTGVLVHDASQIVSGIRLMHENSEAGDAGLSDTLDDIESDLAAFIEDEIFAQGRDIKIEVNQIMSLVLSKKLGPPSDDFALFMKAFIQANWKFPTGVFTALSTFKAIAAELGMSPQELWTAKKTHAIPVLKNALHERAVNARAMLGQCVDCVVQPLQRKAEAVLSGVRSLRSSREVVGNLTRVINSFHDRGSGAGLSLAQSKGVSTPAVIQAQVDHKMRGKKVALKDIDYGVTAEKLANQEFFAALDAQQQKDVIESVVLYFQIFTLIKKRESPFFIDMQLGELNSKETFLFEFFALNEWADSPVEIIDFRAIIARRIALRALKARYPDREVFDALSPSHIIAQSIADSVERNFISDLRIKDLLDSFDLFKDDVVRFEFDRDMSEAFEEMFGSEQLDEFEDFMDKMGVKEKKGGSNEELDEKWGESSDQSTEERGEEKPDSSAEESPVPPAEEEKKEPTRMDVVSNPELYDKESDYDYAANNIEPLKLSSHPVGQASKVDYERSDEASFPAAMINSEILRNIKDSERGLKPDESYSGQTGDVIYMAGRTGFTREGRFGVYLLDTVTSEGVFFSMDVDEFHGFIKGEEIQPKYSERWAVVEDGGQEEGQPVLAGGGPATSLAKSSLTGRQMGGIDFELDQLQLNIQGPGPMLESPVAPLPPILPPIEGLSPTIHHIVPITYPNLIYFLGLSDQPSLPQISRR